MSFVNFGEVLVSHEQAVAFARSTCELPVSRRFPTVITSAAGYPLDKTYYQSVKGIVAAIDILAPGGDLIVVSECSEGMGSAEFIAAQQRLVRLGPAGFANSLMEKSHADIDEWQSQMLLKALAAGNVIFFTKGLDAAHWALTGVNVVSSLDDAVIASLSRSSDRAVAVIPEGPYVVPFLGRPATSI
jgi:nickel-dependent lactate racemase